MKKGFSANFPWVGALRLFLASLTLLTLSHCKKSKSDECTSVTTNPPGTTSAPSMTFYIGATSDSTGTTLTALNQISGSVTGCGPFGIWESGNGGEVATEIEIRLMGRLGVFAMADGTVTAIQSTSQPFEAGEVEGVFVRYGENYSIKYAHVVNPIVAVGDIITKGQRLGTTVRLTGGDYFWEAELQKKSGSTYYAIPWNGLLTNAAVFNSLYNFGSCTPGGAIKGTDGVTATTASNWVNDNLSPAQWDITNAREVCAF